MHFHIFTLLILPHDSREVSAEEAKHLNLVNYLVKRGTSSPDAAFDKALEVAKTIASHPQACLRNDRSSMLRNAYGQSELVLLKEEFEYGMRSLNDKTFGTAVEAFVNKSKL